MHFLSRAAGVLLWLSPLFVAMAYDAWSRRKVHRVYLIGLAALLIVFTRVFLEQYEPWLRIGRALLRPLI
jgi:hypothetical protein